MGKTILAAALLAFGMPAAVRADHAPTPLRCSGSGGLAAMENSYIVVPGAGPCWMHLGHHTYHLGGLFKVGAVSGSIFSVEVQLSPPTELADPTTAAVVLEGSPDGRSWTALHAIPYRLVGSQRQSLTFAFDASGFEARFLRIRQPRSAAQGLSGYLDHSQIDAHLEAVPADDPVRTSKTRALACGADILDPALPGHPCWFGGVNRYDAASFFHTYPLGGTGELTRIRGSVTFLPWRTDDYSSGSSRTEIGGVVQVSPDGVSWTQIGTTSGVYGAPIAFDLDGLGGVPARFVRLAAERHARYTEHPALKHLRGMILDSSIEVAGLLP